MSVDERLYDSSYFFPGMKSADADPTASAAGWGLEGIDFNWIADARDARHVLCMNATVHCADTVVVVGDWMGGVGMVAVMLVEVEVEVRMGVGDTERRAGWKRCD